MFARTVVLAMPLLLAAWTPELQMKVRSLDDVIPSPDGQWVVWTQTESVIDAEKSENRTHLWLGRADGSRRFQLTRGEKSATSPQWAVDSKHLYFTSDRSGKRALYRIAVQGGEAETAFEWKGGSFGSYQLSPNGKLIAFVGTEEDPALERNRRAKTDFKVIDEWRPAGLYVVDLNTKAIRKLYANTSAASSGRPTDPASPLTAGRTPTSTSFAKSTSPKSPSKPALSPPSPPPPPPSRNPSILPTAAISPSRAAPCRPARSRPSKSF